MYSCYSLIINLKKYSKMKRFGNLLIIFALMAIAVGCGKDDNKDKPGNPDNPNSFLTSASYEVKLDGEVLIKNDKGYAHISESVNDINSGIDAHSGVTKVGDEVQPPEENISIVDIQNLKVGESMPIGVGGNFAEVGVVKSYSEREVYTILSGTVTREAEDKISFTSTRIESHKDGETKTEDKNLSGYIISDEVKKIGQHD